jgi:Initiator Replication protein
LLTLYPLRIDEIRHEKAVTIYTRWLEAAQVKDESVSVTLNPRFKRIWLEVKKRLIDSAGKAASPGFRSQFAIRLFSWAKSTSEPRVFQSKSDPRLPDTQQSDK